MELVRTCLPTATHGVLIIFLELRAATRRPSPARYRCFPGRHRHPQVQRTQPLYAEDDTRRGRMTHWTSAAQLRRFALAFIHSHGGATDVFRNAFREFVG